MVLDDIKTQEGQRLVVARQQAITESKLPTENKLMYEHFMAAFIWLIQSECAHERERTYQKRDDAIT